MVVPVIEQGQTLGDFAGPHVRRLTGEFNHLGGLAFVEFAGVALAGDDVTDFHGEEHVLAGVPDDGAVCGGWEVTC